MTPVPRYLLAAALVALVVNAVLLYRAQSPGYVRQRPLARSGARLAHFVSQKPNAAIYALVRNRELGSLLETMQDMERNFNAHPDTQYPYVFLNDEPFTDRFMRHVRAATRARVYFGQVPPEEWAVPASVDMDRARKSWDLMQRQHVAYADSQSYRQMCRYQSGLFMNHPLMQPFDYYWRIEPGVSYFCEMLDPDPFRVMRDRQKKYGWVITLRDDPRTLPTLWEQTQAFRTQYPQYAMNTSMMPFFQTRHKQYNTCHFWTNFEIADLRWMRSEAYQAFFRHLDATNGFFYERWGDAPMHSLAVGLFLNESEVHYFEDIGYQHPPFRHCPVAQPGRCACVPEDSLGTEYSGSGQNCLYLWNKLHGELGIDAFERLRVAALET
ncbi:hypothetical protein GLX27_003748 [Malassezia furfur]|uniref:Glycolipid 2-alpha-mannosyltransferase n=1 Tax=Malassezia furfur TaxID=55194 RepID=A0ABY8EXP4_MALFU|nr:hypothetical protein GLX27_003748 [Malassezia furfur]